MCTKICRTCGEVKSIEDFPYQQKHGLRGKSGNYRLDCFSCTASKARAYRKTYVPKGNKKRTDVDQVLYQACGMRVADAKSRSTTVFDLTKDYMYDLYLQQGGLCAVSGIQMQVAKGVPHTLSIDKVDPAKGYTKSNVQWVSWAVNRAKGDLTMPEFLAMCEAICKVQRLS